jgi:Holliday junction resolvase RusA-like endonuclease
VSGIELVLPGRAQGKGRPRFNTKTGRAYSDKQTRSQEELLRQVWLEVGRPTLGEVPLAVDVEVILARPRDHFRKDGSLSASGLRKQAPTGRPDLDNVVKLLDGLNTLAFRDDAQIVYIEARKRWADSAEEERTLIRIYEFGTAAVAV